MSGTERHNWSESDEKSLVSTVTWVEENISKAACASRGGKWNVISGLLFTDIGLKVSGNACQCRHKDIRSRLKKTESGGQEVLTFLGVDFPQATERTEEEKLRSRVAILERRVDNLVNSLNELSGLKDEIAIMAGLIEKKVGKDHWHSVYQFSSRTGDVA